MIDYDDLQYAHKDTCQSKNSLNIEKRNVIIKDEDIVEYTAYCKECGKYLYHFNYGNIEV